MVGVADISVWRLEELYRRQYLQAVDWCKRRFSDASQVEDIVQDAFLQISRAVMTDKIDLQALPEVALVRQHLRWAMSKRIRQQQSSSAREHEFAVICRAGDEKEWWHLEARQHLADVWPFLSTGHQTVLRLRFAEGHSDAEGAHILGISVKAFRCKRDRALLAARQIVGDVPTLVA